LLQPLLLMPLQLLSMFLFQALQLPFPLLFPLIFYAAEPAC